MIAPRSTTYSASDPSLIKQLHVIRDSYLPLIETAAARSGTSPAIIAGIGSRESHWGLSPALDKPGPEGRGDNGHGRGLMQIDDRYHEFARSGRWYDPTANLQYAATVLIDARAYIHNRFPFLSPEALLHATISAYNAGPGNVAKAITAGRDPDSATTGRDYGRDVLSRASWFEQHGLAGGEKDGNLGAWLLLAGCVCVGWWIYNNQ